MADMNLPELQIENDLGFEVNLSRKAAGSVATNTATSVAWRYAPTAIKASKDYLLNRGAQEVAIGTTKILAPEAGEAVASTFVPGIGFFMGLGMNGYAFYNKMSALQTFAEKSDAGNMYILFDPEARGAALRAVGDFVVNTGVDVLSFIPLVGGTANFVVSTAVRGALLARDIADPNSVALTAELQSAIDNGQPVSLNRMALAIQKMAEEKDPKLAAEIKTAIAMKDPAVATTLYEMAEAMSGNRSAAGTLKYAIDTGELMQHLQQERAKTGQMLGMQTIAPETTAPQKAATPEIERLKKKLGIQEKLLESSHEETAARLTDHGIKTAEQPREPKKHLITGKNVAYAAAAATAAYAIHKTGAVPKTIEAVRSTQAAKHVAGAVESLNQRLEKTKQGIEPALASVKEKAGAVKNAVGAKVENAVKEVKYHAGKIPVTAPGRAADVAAAGFRTDSAFGNAVSAEDMKKLVQHSALSDALKEFKSAVIDAGSGTINYDGGNVPNMKNITAHKTR